MGLLQDDEIAGIRDRVDIADVVRESVTLKSAGSGKWKGLCPFHSESTPSFQVNSDRGLWHCFGCGEVGDAIDYLQRLDGLTFVEAVETLADRVNVTLTRNVDDVDPNLVPRRALVDVNSAAKDYFYTAFTNLPDSHPAVTALTDRGFTRQDCHRHHIGYAPQGNTLTTHLAQQGFTVRQMVEAGVAMENGAGAKDRFTDRVIWPITSPKGIVIGFGARQLPTTPTGPKYLNTGDTALYRKSNVLYGLSDARKDFSQSRQVVIAEGYTDVMALTSAGVAGAVATCGTAFGAGHIDVLNRTSVGVALNIIFMFDGDAAGRKAILRGYSLYETDPARVFVAVTPNGLDPCDLRKSQGDEALAAAVAARTPVVEYLIATIIADHDIASPTGKAAAADACAAILSPITNMVLKVEYEKLVSEWLNIDSAHVVRAARSRPQPPPRNTRARAAFDNTSPDSSAHLEFPSPNHQPSQVEQEAIKAVLQYPAITRDWFLSVEPTAFAWSGTQAVHAHICDHLQTLPVAKEQEPEWLHALISSAATSDLRAYLVQSSMNPLRCDPDDVPTYTIDAISMLIDRDAAQRVNNLGVQLATLEPDSSDYVTIFANMMALIAVRKTMPHRNRHR